MATRQYFGYGPILGNKKKIANIIGRDPEKLVGKSAVIRGFQLAYQSLKQIPESVSKRLTQWFGESFKAYTLVKGNGVVSGVVWEITDDEFLKLQKWNFAGEWRMMTENTVILEDNSEITAVMDIIPPTQRIEGTIQDGIEKLADPRLEALHEGKITLKEYREELKKDDIKTREVLRMIAQGKHDSPRMYA